MGDPRQRTTKHKLLPDIEAFVRGELARRGVKAMRRVLSASDDTILELLDIGIGEAPRDRIERYAAGMMRAQGLVPSERPPRFAPPPAKTSASGAHGAGGARGGRSPDVLEELQGIRAGQVWSVPEPSGREVLVRIVAVALGHSYFRGHFVRGRTPSGRHRVLGVGQLLRIGRLVEDAAPACADPREDRASA